MKTPKTDALQASKNNFSTGFWEQFTVEFGKPPAEIEALLAAQGCPTDAEIEAAFFAETGMSFEAAGERAQVRAELEAEARYDERYCR